MKRRILLKQCLSTITVLLAGCLDDTNVSSNGYSHLVLRLLVDVTETESDWQVNGTASGSSTVSNVLHNVTVLGYSREGKLICQQDLGDINGLDSREFELKCAEFPFLFTAKADETPCDDKVVIEVLSFAGTRDGERVWQIRTRRCEEGLPPAPLSGNDEEST